MHLIFGVLNVIYIYYYLYPSPCPRILTRIRCSMDEKYIRYTSPVFGKKIFSYPLDMRLCNVLNMPRPKRPNFYFLVKTLKECDYPFNEMLTVVDKYNRWTNYNRSLFYEESRKVYKERKHNSLIVGAEKSPFINAPTYTSNDELTDIDIIKLFLDKCDPWDLKPPITIKDAVIYYYFEGAHVIPMRNGEKKPYWGLSWQEYQNRQPTKDEIVSWDWSYGICLLGTEKHCTLDIDIKSPSHPQGLANFNEDVLDGWCYERTKNGGYHVFGCGNFPVIRGDAVGIHGRGAYVVTSPTEGYTFHHHG